MTPDTERMVLDALRDLLALTWAPDSAPGPSLYIGIPIEAGPKAIARARAALSAADREAQSGGEPIAAVLFLRQAASYFRDRPTGGEDRAHWANVYNAENCEQAAATIERITRELAEAKRPRFVIEEERTDGYDAVPNP